VDARTPTLRWLVINAVLAARDAKHRSGLVGALLVHGANQFLAACVRAPALSDGPVISCVKSYSLRTLSVSERSNSYRGTSA
jgi:hypothetical protein